MFCKQLHSISFTVSVILKQIINLCIVRGDSRLLLAFVLSNMLRITHRLALGYFFKLLFLLMMAENLFLIMCLSKADLEIQEASLGCS